MNRFQQGSLFRAKRKGCSDVWVFRCYDYSSGKRIYKQIIGSVAQIRSKRKSKSCSRQPTLIDGFCSLGWRHVDAEFVG